MYKLYFLLLRLLPLAAAAPRVQIPPARSSIPPRFGFSPLLRAVVLMRAPATAAAN
jgi:hypothetical protein